MRNEDSSEGISRFIITWRIYDLYEKTYSSKDSLKYLLMNLPGIDGLSTSLFIINFQLCVEVFYHLLFTDYFEIYVNKYKLLYFSTNTQKCHHSNCLSELHSSSHSSIYRFIHPSIHHNINPSIHPSFHQSFDLWLK